MFQETHSLLHGPYKSQQKLQLSRPLLNMIHSVWYSLCSSLQVTRSEGEEIPGKKVQVSCHHYFWLLSLPRVLIGLKHPSGPRILIVPLQSGQRSNNLASVTLPCLPFQTCRKGPCQERKTQAFAACTKLIPNECYTYMLNMNCRSSRRHWRN